MRTWLLAGLCWAWAMAAPTQTLPLPLPPGGKGFAPEGTTLVVKFKPQTDSKAHRILPNVRNHYVLQQLGVESMPQLFPGRTAQLKNKRAAQAGVQPVDLSRLYRITIAPGRSTEEAIRLLESDPDIEYAEPLYRNYKPLYVPNDPQAQSINGGQYHLANIKAYQAWDIHKGDPKVTIGIIDFGTDVNHEDLKDNIQYNTADPVNGVDDDKDGYLDNYAGWNTGNKNNQLFGNLHGSFVAGMAAGTPDNGIGIAGIGFNCKFLPVTGSGSDGWFYGYEGILYLVEKGCKVINLSWGRTGPYSQLEQDVINYAAINNDVVVVAAAGNENTSTYYWPASYDNVISVAATDKDDIKAFWGHLGSSYNNRVDISAPGGGVYSTNNSNQYGFNWGTSFAAPLVAGAAALMRSRFPLLTAAEISDWLIDTSDPIDHLSGNAPYAGMLGKGRLNVYRALAEPKGLKLMATAVEGYRGQPYFWPGQETKLAVQLWTYGTFNNLQVSLVSNSPYATVLDGEAVIGSVVNNTLADNANHPFIIAVKPGTPANTPVSFTLTSRDGAFTRTETVTIRVNPDYLNVDVNELQLTATSRGRVGYNDNYTAQGIGVRYKNQSLLYEAGLMIAASPTKVSDCVRDNTGNFTKNDHFRAAHPIWFDTSNGADFSAAVTLSDAANSVGAGVQVRQQVYAWKDSPYHKAVVFEYKITNVSGADLPQLYAGLFADWSIYGDAGNQAQWDEARKLGYAFNATSNDLYAGIRLLTGQTPQYYAFDNKEGINTYDGFSPSEKYVSLSGGLARTQSAAGADDIAQAVGAQLGGLKNGETRIVAFAFLAGDNLADLQRQADAIQQKFIAVKTSPLPVATHPGVCINGVAEIIPSGGSAFNLYARQSDSSPVSSGTRFNLGSITKDTTVYISGTDSLYESDRVAVSVKAVASQAFFTVNRDTLGLYEKHLLEPADGSTNAVSWHWNFGDGSTAENAKPSHAYATPGEYTVTLTTANHLGCLSTTSRKVWVTPGVKSNPPTVAGIDLCAYDRIRIVPGNGSRFHLYASLPLTEPVATGASFELTPSEKDTVFYLTGADCLYESEPVAIPVRVSPVRAAFATNRAQLDLREEDVLKLTDGSTNAVSWHWNFGDGTTSQAQHPVHEYAQPGEYTVTLQCRNSMGCTDSISQKVKVIHTLVQELAKAITMYPNPSSGVLHLGKDNGFFTDRLSVTVVDVLGKVVLRREIDSPAKITDLVIPAKGLFLVRISANGQAVLRRVLVL